MTKIKKKLPEWMTRTLNKMDMEDFIEIMKENPVIWDSTTQGYGDAATTSQAWNTVCKSLDDEFEERDERDQDEFCVQLHKKWKNVRDCYRRELRRLRAEQGDPTDRKVYRYFDLLGFLDSVMGVSQTADRQEDPAAKGVGVSDEYKPTPSALRPRKRKIKPEESDDDDDEFTTTVSREYTTNEPVNTNPPTTGDGDVLFMMSLISEMKKIPENKRLQVKVKLMNVILDAQTNLDT